MTTTEQASQKAYLENIIVVLDTTPIAMLSELLNDKAAWFNWQVEDNGEIVNRITLTKDEAVIAKLSKFAIDHNIGIKVITPVDDQPYGRLFIKFPAERTQFHFFTEEAEDCTQILTAPSSHTVVSWLQNTMTKDVHPTGFDGIEFELPKGNVLNVLRDEFNEWVFSYLDFDPDLAKYFVKNMPMLNQSPVLINPHFPLITYHLRRHVWTGLGSYEPEIKSKNARLSVNSKFENGTWLNVYNFSQQRMAAASIQDEQGQWWKKPINVGYFTISFNEFKNEKFNVFITPSVLESNESSEQYSNIAKLNEDRFDEQAKKAFDEFKSPKEPLLGVVIIMDEKVVFESSGQVYMPTPDQPYLIKAKGKKPADELPNACIGNVHIQFLRSPPTD